MRRSWKLLSLACLVLACAPQETSNETSEAARVASGVVDPSVAKAAIAEDEFDPAGFWELAWLPGYDHTTLVLERLDGERWRARFYRATCVGNPSFEVSARREAGVIVLETPARVTDKPFRALLPARIDGLDCLVPEVYQDKLDRREPLLPPPGTSKEGWAFVRGEARDPADFHARWLAEPWPTFEFGTAGEEEITLEDLDAEEEQEEK